MCCPATCENRGSKAHKGISRSKILKSSNPLAAEQEEVACLGVGEGLGKFCIWGKALETSTNRNIILHPAKITSVLLPPPFAWHGIPIIQIPIKMSTEISGNCGERKYAGAESPFVLRAQQTWWRDRKSVNSISKAKKNLLQRPNRTFQHHWTLAVCTFFFQNAALLFLLTSHNSPGKVPVAG